MKNNDEALLAYYHQELLYLKEAGSAFAQKHPDIAQGLSLSSQGHIKDPHLERLIDSFAYLCARLQKNIDDQTPILARALLDILYPALTRPLPSMSILSFESSMMSGQSTSLVEIAKGSEFITHINGDICRYQTVYPTTIVPLTSYDTQVVALSSAYDIKQGKPSCPWYLKIKLTSPHFNSLLKENNWDQLRFYLKGEFGFAATLYENLLKGNHLPFFYSLDQKTASSIPLSLTEVGFEVDETMAPCPSYSLPIYQNLQEFFSFPEKFLFLDLKNLSWLKNQHIGSTLEIFIPITSELFAQSLIHQKDYIKLGCTPIINLFKTDLDPLLLNYERVDYPLVADWSQEKNLEIYQLLQLETIEKDELTPHHIHPYFSMKHYDQNQKLFWVTHSNPHPSLNGTQTNVSFVDLDLSLQSKEKTIFGKALCTNRDLPRHLSMDQIFQMDEGDGSFSPRCLVPPTAPIYPQLSSQSLWKLISQLSLSYIPLQNDHALESLKEQLRLYATHFDQHAFLAIESLKDLSINQTISRLGDQAWRGFVPCIHICLTVHNEQGYFLLSQILRRYFETRVGFHQFVDFELKLSNHQESLYRWKPHKAAQILSF